MESNEIEMESESFAHEIEELIENENLASMMDLQDIDESDMNDLSTGSDSLQDTCFESSWQGVLNSTDKTWDKREINGSMTPCHLLNPEEVDSMLAVHSDNAELKPAFSTVESLADYSDVSSCSETETNLDCNFSSSVEVDMGVNQPGQSDETNQQQDTVGSETSMSIGESKGDHKNNEGGEWKDGSLLTNVNSQFSEGNGMGDLNCAGPLAEGGQIEQSDIKFHDLGCSVDHPMMNCKDLGASQEGSTCTLNKTNMNTSSILKRDENNCSTSDLVGCHPNKLDLGNTSSKPKFEEIIGKSSYETDSLSGCHLQENTDLENASSRPEFEEALEKSSIAKDSLGGCQLEENADLENASSQPEFEEALEKSSIAKDSLGGCQLEENTDLENASSQPEFDKTFEKSSSEKDSFDGYHLQENTDLENASSRPEFEEALEKSSIAKDSLGGCQLEEKTDLENASPQPEFDETFEKSSIAKDSLGGCQLEENTDLENASPQPELDETSEKSSIAKDSLGGCQLEENTDLENASPQPEFDETFEKSSIAKDSLGGCHLQEKTDLENTSSRPEFDETFEKSSIAKDSLGGCQLEENTDLENASSQPEFKETFEKSSIEKDSIGGCHLQEKTDLENTSPKPEFEETFDYEKTPQMDKQKSLTSNDKQVVERSSFGFLESCFGLKSTEQNIEECLEQGNQTVETNMSVGNVTQDPKCNLFNRTESPILLKAAFESNTVEMDEETSAQKYSPVLSPCQMPKTTIKTQKRKLQPVVLLPTTEQKSCDGRDYHCFECKESTQTLDELIEHCHYVHSLHKIQYCATCECYFTGDTSAGHFCEKFKLMDHVNSSPVCSKRPKREAKFICRYCKKAFVRQVYHEEHEQRHRAVTQHRCERCGLYFPNAHKCHGHKNKGSCPPLILEPSLETKDHTESALKKLEMTDLALDRVGSNIKLSDCYVKLVDVCKTKQSPNQIECHFCGKSFRLRAQLKSHLISHSDEKPFKCENCKKDFKYSWNLNKHKREVCPRSQVPLNKSSVTDSKFPAKFKCPVCLHLFKYSYNRTRHLREQCLKEYMRKGKGKIGDKYVCPLCKDKFTMASNRNRHIKNTCLKFKLFTAKGKIIGREELEEEITTNKKGKDLPQTQPIQNVTRYYCTFCPATYSSKSGFYSHLAKHKLSANTKKANKYKHNTEDLKSLSTESTDRNASVSVTCRFCGRVFISPHLLKRHLLLHKGNRPFRCLDCGKNFARHAHLMAHRNVHKRKIQCSVCREVLPSIGELLKHRQSHPKRGTLKCPECPMQFKFPVFLLRHVVVHERRRKLMTPPQAPAKVAVKVEEMYKEEFKCAVCQKAFADSKAFSEHCLTHMPERCASKCQFCKRNFSNRTGLVRHIRLHTGEKPFPCLKCGKHFHRQEALKVHQEKCRGVQQLPNQSNTKPVPAKGTADIAPNKTNKPYNCSYCPHSFRFPNNLKFHEKAHLAKTIFPCPKCGIFYRKRKLKDHMNFCQGSGLPACQKCGRTFIRPNYKNIHETNCQGKVSKETKTNLNRFKHQCSQCSKCFRYRSFLLRHLGGHSKKKPHACMHCGQKCKSEQHCLQHKAFSDGVSKEHELEHSGETEKTEPVFAKVKNEEEVKLVPAENSGEFKCKFCTKSFARARYLRRHILTHTDVKPYRCKTCDGCFSRYDHLKLHQNRCRGKQKLEVRVVKILDTMSTDCQEETVQDNDFQCKICLKQLSTSSDLKRHMAMLHITVKPFPCKRCGKTYSSKKSLRRHNLEVKCKKVLKEGVQPPKINVQPPKNNVQNQPCRETSKLLQRIQVHYLNKYKCSYCPRHFKLSGQLKVHERLHTGEKPYGCANCGEHFIRRDYLKRHLIKCSGKAENQEKVLCDKCGDLFTQEALRVHQHTCTLSSKSSGSSKEIKSGSPTKVKGFSCANCSDRFLLFSQLQQHFLAKHRTDQFLNNGKQQIASRPLQILKQEPTDEGYGQSQPSSSQLPTNRQPEISDKDLIKPFKCSYCPMRFVSKAGLGMHMRIHTGVYPFVCTKCHVGFWAKKAMEKHKKKCTGHTIVTNNSTQLNPQPSKSSMEIAGELESTDTVLVFNKGSNTTGTGVLQTKFSCKDQENDSDKGDAAIHKYQCSECDQSFTDGLRLISHLEEHGREDQERRSGDVHRCHVCSRVFGQASFLQRHMKTQHAYRKRHSCPLCLRHFRCPSDLDIHMPFHDPNRPFVCNVCALRFWTTKAMTIHQKLVHFVKETPYSKESSVKEPELYKCQPCDRVYTSKKSYRKHCRMKHKQDSGKPLTDNYQLSVSQESDKEESSREFEDDDSDNDSDSAPYFPCHVCGKTFLTSESLEDHQRCHLGEKPFECEECGKCFVQLVNLQQHQRSHKSEFQCQMCGKGFVSNFALRKHKQSHVRNTPHKCTKCHLSFTRSTELAEHMVTHRDENFPCDLCDETFSCKTSRDNHRKRHTVQEEDLPPLIPPSEPQTVQMTTAVPGRSLSSNVEQYRYRCGICQVRFPDPEQLSEHGCNPAKERPYSCPECNKHFLHGSHLKKHQLSHQLSGRNSYQCNRCSMSFSHHHHYLTHLRSHRDEEPHVDTNVPNSEKMTNAENPKRDKIYQCPICPESFYQALDLANHLSVHSHMCSVCNMTFATKENLEEHEQCHLTAATQYECTECGGSFLGSDAFRKHHCSSRKLPFSEKRTSESSLSSPHKKQRSERLFETGDDEEEEVDVGEDFFKCTICQKRFSSSSSLLEHHKIEHERPFKCLVCGKGFTRKRYLTQHQQVHSERPYQCNVCSQAFRTETALVSHSKLHDTKRQHHCLICNRSYLTAKDLHRHKQTHIELKSLKKDDGDFRCDMCYKSFSLFSQLTKHQESHVGQVVYECTECDKAFAFPSLLEEHQRTHAVSTESLQPQPPIHFTYQNPVHE